MAEVLHEVCIPSEQPSKILKIKVKKGRHVNKGEVLALYTKEKKPDESDCSDSKPIPQKLKSNFIGNVVEVAVKEGEVIQPGCVVVSIGPCQHPTVMKDMCAECGVDLRFEFGKSGDRKEPVSASVAMVHSIPELIVSEEQALELGQEDQYRLLKNRKLVLLVDLDQTLIHTTNDNIPPNLKGVNHFQQWHGKGWMWYHTQVRPHTQEFLERISEYYEMHICSFGVRMYAHTIAKIIDPDGKYFSHRILSRDECFNAQLKVANLKALFPCGDSMVCIIDDREDVWKYSTNLIHVKPYHFFQGTADINAPPGLTKTEDDNKPVVHRVRTISHSKSKDSVDEKKDLQATSDNVSTESKLIDSGTSEPNGKSLKQECTDPQMEVDELKQKKDEEKLLTSTVPSISSKEHEDSERMETDTAHPENSHNADSADIVDNAQTQGKKSEVSHSDACEAIDKMGNMDIKTAENKTDKTDVEPSDIQDTPQCNDKDGADNNNKVTSVSVDDVNRQKEEKQEELKDTDKQQSGVEKRSDDSDIEEEIIWEDEDDYLLYLPEVLIKIHNAFYNFYDQMKNREQNQLPDLKHIIPYVRKKVLRGVNVVFSGVIPRNMLAESSRAYKVAKSLGANIQNEIVLKDNGNKLATTHLVAARLGTAKVNMCRKMKKKIKIVTPQWLWICSDRWEHVDERLFPLTDETSVSGTNSPVLDSNKLKSSSQRNGRKRKLDERESEGDLFENKPDNFSDSAIDSLGISSDSTSDDSSIPEVSCFAESVNPLMSFTNAELLNMDKEVEDLLGDDDENGSSSSENERYEAKLRKKVLSPRYEYEDSSVDSIDGAYPRGWRKKRRIEEIDKDTEESEVGEEYNEIEHASDLLLNIKKDLEVSTSSESGDKDSIGSVDDELAEAVEREFLS